MSAGRGVASIRTRVESGKPVLICIAGPNGAGKTTFFQTFLEPIRLRFVNADVIARALSPTDPGLVAYEAANLAEIVRNDLLSRGVTFCMETVFSDREGSKVEFLRRAQRSGYYVYLIFIGLESIELSTLRVQHRVERGGHDVPDDKLIERFPRSIRNLTEALVFADTTYIYDNSRAEDPHRFVAELQAGVVIRKGELQPEWWTQIAP